MPSTYLHGIAPVVPPHAYPQEVIGEVLRAPLEPGGLAERLSHRVYRNSGIETRHSVISGHEPGTADGVFFDRETGAFRSPSTGERNDAYVEAARPMFVDTARKALERSGFGAQDITHVVTVSCTGFFAPGPDYYIARDLGLRSDVERYHVGFMGCYAAFPALRMADSFCAARPDAAVLVVCLELCTVHLEPRELADQVIAGSVFADGAAGVVVSRRPPEGPGYEWVASTTRVAPDSEEHMAWRIGDRGFEMALSTYVPRVLGAQVGVLVDGILASIGQSRAAVDRWLIHPGGRSILDHVEASLGLPADALAPSRAVLARYGNLSSATILFVMEEALRTGHAKPGELAYAMAFGPGLTVESALLRAV